MLRNDTDLGFGPWWLPPTDVMRSALLCTIPFAIIWAAAGHVGWGMVLSNFGSTWPPFWHSTEIGAVVLALAALSGAVCAVAFRVFLWLLSEQKRQRLARLSTRRPVRVVEGVKTEQNWEGTDFIPSRD
jgi:hypothetical protein